MDEKGRALVRDRTSRTALWLLLGVLCHTRAEAQARIAWYDTRLSGGLQIERFACDSEDGRHVLVVSLQPGEDLVGVTKVSFEITVMASRESLPPWWAFDETGCRSTAIRIRNVNLNDPPFEAGFSHDAWLGRGASTTSAYERSADGRTGTLTVELVPRAGVRPVLLGGNDYALCAVDIGNESTLSGCGGCSEGVCILLEKMSVSLETGVPRGVAATGLASWQGAQIYVPGPGPKTSSFCQ